MISMTRLGYAIIAAFFINGETKGTPRDLSSLELRIILNQEGNKPTFSARTLPIVSLFVTKEDSSNASKIRKKLSGQLI